MPLWGCTPDGTPTCPAAAREDQLARRKKPRRVLRLPGLLY
jgi:hypothetical protein